jgi:sulfite exporter TauE/SafE
MSTLTFTMALLMGFTGSLHCAGMCGPIMWVLPFQLFTGYRKILALTLYHAGRISVYALLGIILHSFRSLFEPRLQQYVSVALGISLLIIGILSFLPNNSLKLNMPWAAYVKKHLGRVVGRPHMGMITLSGILNGLLPCGLVYMALSASVTATSPAQSALMMYAFGLGTMPMLLSITLLKARLSFLKTNHIRKMIPVVVFSFGCLFVLRGMNLGIPYLSPKVVVSCHEIKSSCCHKK